MEVTGAAPLRTCIVYARVSTEDQARRGYSLTDQVELCTARAAQLGYPPASIAILKDEGLSGDLVDRPGLNKLRELVAEKGAVGHVIIYDPDRFARNLSLQLIVTEEIVRGGAALEFINFDWKDTPEGKLFYSLRGAIAEYEKAKIKERTRRGREQKAKQGRIPVGKSLYGFRYNPVSDQLEPVEEEQAVLRLICDLVLHGAPGEGKPLSCVQAAKWLAEHGVPAPKGNLWYASTITKMLRNESYTGTHWVLKTDTTSGKRVDRPKDKQYKVELPPVWDEATRQALITKIEANKWLKVGRRSQGNFLLKGLIYCGTCGDGVIQMRGHSIKDHRRDYQYYICYKNHGRPVFDTETGQRVKCPSRHWNARQIDEAVWRRVKEAIKNPGEIIAKHNELQERPEERERFANELTALEASVAQKEAECDRYLRLFAMGHIDSDTKLQSMLGPAKKELAALKERRDEVHGTLIAMKQEEGFTQAFLLSVDKLGRTMDGTGDDDFERKREIITKLVKRVIVNRQGIEIVGYLSIPFESRDGSEGDMSPGPSRKNASCHVIRSAHRQLER